MADSSIPVTSGSGNNVDVFQLANSNLRQAIVIGDSSIVNNVAPVQQTDPTSATQGLVVRDVNTSAIVGRLGQTMFVQLDPGHLIGSVTANAGTGTFTVQFDPGHTLGLIDSINKTVTVQFDPGHLLGSVTANAGTGTFTVQFDPGHELGTIKGNSNTLTVFLPDTGHEIGTIRGNTNTLTVFIPDTGHTIGKVDAGSGTFTVKLDPSSKIAGSDSSLAVYLGATAGTINVALKPGTIAVSLDPGFTLGKVDQGVASTTQPWLINQQGTASIFTASGSASGVSVSGNTIISPSANASFKIYAFSVQTTGAVSLTTKFTNGAGTSPTEYWRPLITASGVTGAQGANLATDPGQPLWVTGTSTTLSLVLDSATLVHYSVSYTKESA